MHLGVLTNDGKEAGDTDRLAGSRYAILSVALIFDDTVVGNAADVPEEVYDTTDEPRNPLTQIEPVNTTPKKKPTSTPAPLIIDNHHKPPAKAETPTTSLRPGSSLLWWGHLSLLPLPLVVAAFCWRLGEK